MQGLIFFLHTRKIDWPAGCQTKCQTFSPEADMARFPFSLYRRPSPQKPGYTYYVQLWNRETKKYDSGKSVARLIEELELDPTIYNATSKSSARLVILEYLKSGITQKPRNKTPLFVDYLEPKNGSWTFR
jgi:hypothetical protein